MCDHCKPNPYIKLWPRTEMEQFVNETQAQIEKYKQFDRHQQIPSKP